MAETRKLAAILAADVVGYSRLAGSDEERTLARLRALRSDLIDPTIAVHNGRVVKRTGDGILIEFRSVVDAVRCAIELQSGTVERNAGLPPERRIEFRVGIHLGDVIEENDGDLMGDGVNIAARLEGIAEASGVCLSEDAFRQVRDKIVAEFTDLGDQQLKNIARPVRAYKIKLDSSADAPKSTPLLPLPDKPSIAVLPFQNMSGDPEQEYFADGIVEDIITALSRFRDLFVIARNSSFTYKGRSSDVKQVGCDLGVRYVLEGSVRRAGNRVRIASQLIDASTGAHLWADRFDEALERIFELQDQVTASVVGQLVPKLEQAEIERAKRKPTSSLDAYQCYLRGMASHYQFTEAGTKEALSFFHKAIDLDPDFASAHGWAAVCYTSRMQSNWMDDPSREVEEGLRLARRAVALGRDDALALACGGFTLAYLGGELETGAAFIDRALKLNPNWAPAWHASGWVRVYLGEHDLAAEHLAQSMRLSPFDPQMFQLATATALAHFFAGRHDDAVSWSGKALMEQPNFAPALRIFAVNSAMAGREKDAERAVSHLRRLYPTHRISVLKTQMPLRRLEDLAKWVEGLRKIGLPE